MLSSSQSTVTAGKKVTSKKESRGGGMAESTEDDCVWKRPPTHQRQRIWRYALIDRQHRPKNLPFLSSSRSQRFAPCLFALSCPAASFVFFTGGFYCPLRPRPSSRVASGHGLSQSQSTVSAGVGGGKRKAAVVAVVGALPGIVEASTAY